MILKSVIQQGLIVTLLSTSLCALAGQKPKEVPPAPNDLIIQPNKIFQPDKLSVDSLQIYEKNFTYDWNNYASVEPNKKKLDEIEAFFKTKPVYSSLNAADQQAMGMLLYKLGSYYVHAANSPDLAITRMSIADRLLKNKPDKAWNYDQLAYAYEQKYTESGLSADKEKAFYYTNKVISELYRRKINKQVAFAYYVKGLIYTEDDDYANAEKNLQASIAIYEKIPDGKDDQYARAKNGLANIILAIGDRDREAIGILQETEKYWQSKAQFSFNPYAALNFIALGQAYLKINDPNDARDEFDKALAIYQKVYGNNSPLLVEPYQDLADTYKQMGDEKLVEAYLKKANKVDKT